VESGEWIPLVPLRRKAERKAMKPTTSTPPLNTISRRCARGEERMPPFLPDEDEEDSIRIETKVPEES
jgi:hypothetical protein